MPTDDVAQKWADAFVKAGHVAKKGWVCDNCGTTLHDFIKRGRLPCLVTK